MKRHLTITATMLPTFFAFVATSATLLAGAEAPTERHGSQITLTCAEAARLDVTAFWKPIEPSQPAFKAWSELSDFQPARRVHQYTGKDFASFLPPTPVKVGDIWAVNTAGALNFMKQFHPGATHEIGGNGDSPEGGIAILASYNDQLAVVLARFNGKFVLKEGWLTPGQFQCTLVLDRDTKQIRYFKCHVPVAAVNFDAGRTITDGDVGGVPIDPKNPPVATDAGVLPQMELRGGDEAVLKGQEWDAALSHAEAFDLLERRLYPFRKIDWVPFHEALALSKKTGKPLHVVTFDGHLCDESCCGSGKALRAGPLSEDRIANLLNSTCINTWALNNTLSTLQNRSDSDDTKALAQAVLEARVPKSSVDSMVFTPSLKLVSVQAANDILGAKRPVVVDRYADFLTNALNQK